MVQGGVDTTTYTTLFRLRLLTAGAEHQHQRQQHPPVAHPGQ